MNILNKLWARIIISLFGGGLTQEILHISTGDPNRPRGMNLTLLYALIIFAVLSWIVKSKNKF